MTLCTRISYRVTFFQHDRYVKKINWYDNPWFPKVEDELRREFERTDPLRYAHIWEGMPDDASAARKILPYHMLRKCVQLWERRPDDTRRIQYGGLGCSRYRRRLECSGLALWPGTVQGRYVEGHGGNGRYPRRPSTPPALPWSMVAGVWTMMQWAWAPVCGVLCGTGRLKPSSLSV